MTVIQSTFMCSCFSALPLFFNAVQFGLVGPFVSPCQEENIAREGEMHDTNEMRIRVERKH